VKKHNAEFEERKQQNGKDGKVEKASWKGESTSLLCACALFAATWKFWANRLCVRAGTGGVDAVA